MGRTSKLIYTLAGLGLLILVGAYFYFLFYAIPTNRFYLQLVMLVSGYINAMLGLYLFMRGLLSKRRYHGITNDSEGGRVYVSDKALRNCIHACVVETGVFKEGRTRLRIYNRKGIPEYRIKLWLGFREGATLQEVGNHLRERIAEDLHRLTGIGASRIDLVFYSLPPEKGEEGGKNP